MIHLYGSVAECQEHPDKVLGDSLLSVVFLGHVGIGHLLSFIAGRCYFWLALELALVVCPSTG